MNAVVCDKSLTNTPIADKAHDIPKERSVRGKSIIGNRNALILSPPWLKGARSKVIPILSSEK
jgi:hypothetical protein